MLSVKTKALDWGELVRREPRLQDLYSEAQQVRSAGRGEIHYQQFKRRLERLVGWGSNDEILGSSEAYEIALCKIYDALCV